MSQELTAVFIVLGLLLTIVPILALSYAAYLHGSRRLQKRRQRNTLPTSTVRTTIRRSVNGRTVFQATKVPVRSAMPDPVVSRPLPPLPSTTTPTSRAWCRLSRPFSYMPTRKPSLHELTDMPSKQAQPHAITRYSEQDRQEAPSRPVSRVQSWERASGFCNEEPVSPIPRHAQDFGRRSPVLGSVPSYKVAESDFTTMPLTPPANKAIERARSQRALRLGEPGFVVEAKNWV